MKNVTTLDQATSETFTRCSSKQSPKVLFETPVKVFLGWLLLDDHNVPVENVLLPVSFAFKSVFLSCHSTWLNGFSTVDPIHFLELPNRKNFGAFSFHLHLSVQLVAAREQRIMIHFTFSNGLKLQRTFARKNTGTNFEAGSVWTNPGLHFSYEETRRQCKQWHSKRRHLVSDIDLFNWHINSLCQDGNNQRPREDTWKWMITYPEPTKTAINNYQTFWAVRHLNSDQISEKIRPWEASKLDVKHQISLRLMISWSDDFQRKKTFISWMVTIATKQNSSFIGWQAIVQQWN